MTKIIIKSGFASITWELLDRPEIMRKGKDLFEAGHVIAIEEHRETDKPTVMVAKVVRQTNVTSAPYSVFIELDEERKVIDGRCTCQAGIVGECKHFSSVVIGINQEKDTSKTSTSCSWNKPPKSGKDLYRKGLPLHKVLKQRNVATTPLFKPPSEERKQELKDLWEKFGHTNSLMFQILSTKSNASEVRIFLNRSTAFSLKLYSESMFLMRRIQYLVCLDHCAVL